jgi:hypothetical protein
MPSSSNFPASHLGSELGLVVESYRAFGCASADTPSELHASQSGRFTEQFTLPMFKKNNFPHVWCLTIEDAMSKK